MWDIIKYPSICKTRASEEKEQEKGIPTWMEMFNLMKNINLHIEETQWFQVEYTQKDNTQTHHNQTTSQKQRNHLESSKKEASNHVDPPEE